jgi:hypothetical protein
MASFASPAEAIFKKRSDAKPVIFPVNVEKPAIFLFSNITILGRQVKGVFPIHTYLLIAESIILLCNFIINIRKVIILFEKISNNER